MTRQVTSIRLSPEVKTALATAARKDGRTFSALTERVLVEWLRLKGYLPKEGKRK